MSKISQATKKNWERLNVSGSEKKLNKRANKRMSNKNIVPVELFSNKDNLLKVKGIVEFVTQNYSVKKELKKIMNSFVFKWMIQNDILTYSLATNKNNVRHFISEYSDFIEEILKIDIPDDEEDILGILYQSFLTEGNKNEKGSYYTPKNIVIDMMKGINHKKGEKILDPCCGTGMFLMGIEVKNPKDLYGTDIDDIAVMIAKANLIVKYKEVEFEPQIFNCDFLKKEDKLKQKFKYIITNPPWGANLPQNILKLYPEIISKESYSCVLIKASKYLEEDGELVFLLPESFLNVKVHADIRGYLINNMFLEKITLYDSNFSGVVTKFISIRVKNKKRDDYNICMTNLEKNFLTSKKEILSKTNFIITLNNDLDKAIIEKVYNRKFSTLKNSQWGLGIVTGNNEKLLKNKHVKNTEPIYTGKEIAPYKLLPVKNYIKYDRTKFQQVASDEIYRAEEKLVYKFISKKIVFAYDNQKQLFLNSANILIPKIENMSIKCVMAFLNSTLFKFLYIKKFGEVKILKGNLMQFPFPDICEDLKNEIEVYVNEILNGNDEYIHLVDNKIYEIFELSKEEIKNVQEVVNGK